ncbi:MAG: hypothetical protein JWN32_2801 [Solirubrobacterales bacterium]|nr:hypothetical protein [Solirubrobacterales bacterium]
MRGTTRDATRRPAIEATGAECYVGDPDRIGTLTYALDNATILCWLLGSATGEAEHVAALHGTRLEMLLERTIDTTVRGVIYEAAGSVDADVLAAGGARVARACAYSEIPFRLVDADPSRRDGWLAAMLEAVQGLLYRDEIP